MSKKLAAKAGLIQALQMPAAPADRTEAPEPMRPKTAPGSMLHFMSSQSAAIKEADDLRERLKSFDGATPVRMIDPRAIRPSRWANRHDASFASADFAELKDEIESAGGNVQPIRVRPIEPVLNGSTVPADGTAQAEQGGVPQVYELVFGHRRHRACLELGLLVKALVEPASDIELFEAMERENRGRKNLSAWEQGCMYRKALDEGLYPSLRKLSEGVKVDVSLVSKSVALARLPDAVVAAFPSPIDIQFRWAQPLSEVLQKDPEGVLQRARALKEQNPAPSAAQVFEALTKPPVAAKSGQATEPTEARMLQRRGRTLASLSRDAKGRVLVKFEAAAVPVEREDELWALLESFVKK